MKIASLDISMNSPGKCIMTLDEAFEIVDIQFSGYHTTKVRAICEDNVNIETVGAKWSKLNYCDRINKAIEILSKGMEEVEVIALEGYSYGSEGKLFEIGEFTGCIKQHFYNLGKSLVSYSPNSVKLFATGAGGADKVKMDKAFKAEYPEHYPNPIYKLPPYESPAADMVDAFWLCMILRYHLMYERDIPLASDIVDALEQSSSRKTKSIVETKVINCFSK